MATRQYLVGKYEEYYNTLTGTEAASGKASQFVTDVNNLVVEFNNIKQIMDYWTGEAKNAMSETAISSIMQKFQTTQDNIQEALVPCCEAVDSLTKNLSSMKAKEDEWLQKQNDLDSEKRKEPDKSKTSEHSNWENRVNSLQSSISSLKTELDGLKESCDALISKIESLEESIKEFTDYLTLTSSIMGIDGASDFSKYSLEERLNYLQEIIDNYTEVYNALNNVFLQRYGEGFKFTRADFEKLDFLFDAFDIYWMSQVKRSDLIKAERGNLIVFDIDKLTKIIGYCSSNDVFTKIESYMNGASWKDSGLESLYADGSFFDTGSANFLNFDPYNEDKFKQRLKKNYGVTGDVREYIKTQYESMAGSYKVLMEKYADYQQLTATMATIQSKIDCVKQAQKLMPYEIQMENADFKGYLNKDYSGYSLLNQEQLSVMTQQEVALYDYLYHAKSKSEAEAYLKAMENTMNQRIGAYRAASYIEYIREGGFGVDDLLKSGWEGTKDGVRNFFDGLADVFRVATTEAGTKSALDYEMLYKAQFMQQLMSDASYVDQGLDKKSLGFVNINNWYNTGTSIGNMVVPSIVSFIPVVGKPMSTTLMTLSIAGNAAVEAKQEGYSTAQSYLYGAVTGLSETATEVMLGGIPGVSNLEGKGIIGSMLSEGLEEFTQEYLDVGARWLILGEKPTMTSKELFNQAMQAGVQGAITSGVMQGGNAALVTGMNVATKAISPTVGVDPITGQNVKKYNSYAEFQMAKESEFYVPRAQSTIDNAITKINNGETLSLTEKIKLNRAMSNVSVEELSNITNNYDSSQISALEAAVKGIPKMSQNSIEKIENAQAVTEINSATAAISDVSSLTDEVLTTEVTRDGRTLAEYIADTKSDVLDVETMSKIETVSPKGAELINSRIEANEKAFEKRVATGLKNGTITQSDAEILTGVRTDTTVHDSQATHDSGTMYDGAVEINIDENSRQAQRTNAQEKVEFRQVDTTMQQTTGSDAKVSERVGDTQTVVGDTTTQQTTGSNVQVSERIADTTTSEQEVNQKVKDTVTQAVAQSAMYQTIQENVADASASQNDVFVKTATDTNVDMKQVAALGAETLAAAQAVRETGGVDAKTATSANASTSTSTHTQTDTSVNTNTQAMINTNSNTQTQTRTNIQADTTTYDAGISNFMDAGVISENNILNNNHITDSKVLFDVTADLRPVVDAIVDSSVSSNEVIMDGAHGDVRRSISTIQDIEYCVEKYMEKYHCTEQEALDQVKSLVLHRSYNYMTSNGNAREVIQKYSFEQISKALGTLNDITKVNAKMVSDVEYCIQKYMEKNNCSRSVAIHYVQDVADYEDLRYMTRNGNARNVLSQYSFKEISAIIQKIEMGPVWDNLISSNRVLNLSNKSNSVIQFFKNNGSAATGTYGVNQGLIYDLFTFRDGSGRNYSYREASSMVRSAIKNNEVIPKFSKIAGEEYFVLKDKIMQRYGISKTTASVIMTCLDDVGACSYASVCNEIFASFNGNSVAFEKAFGFPMYEEVNGQRILNAKELMIDLYIYANTSSNGGSFLVENHGVLNINSSQLSDQVDPLGRRLVKTNNQVYMSNGRDGKNVRVINSYLKSKGLGFNSSLVKGMDSSVTHSQMVSVANRVIDGMNQGKVYSLGIYSNGATINMIAPTNANYRSTSTSTWNEGAGHSIFVTNVIDKGFVVSSWGREYLIPFRDLACGGKWVLSESEISTTSTQKAGFFSRYRNAFASDSSVNVESSSHSSFIGAGDSAVYESDATPTSSSGNNWQYVIQHNSSAGKAGTVIDVDMNLIDSSLTPDGNLKKARDAWNKAGKPTEGETFRRLQSAYAYSKMAGGTNASAISNLHQTTDNINYKSSMFRSDTTEQGMSKETFNELMKKSSGVQIQSEVNTKVDEKASTEVNDKTQEHTSTELIQEAVNTQENVTPGEVVEEVQETVNTQENVTPGEVVEEVQETVNTQENVTPSVVEEVQETVNAQENVTPSVVEEVQEVVNAQENVTPGEIVEEVQEAVNTQENVTPSVVEEVVNTQENVTPGEVVEEVQETVNTQENVTPGEIVEEVLTPISEQGFVEPSGEFADIPDSPLKTSVVEFLSNNNISVTPEVIQQVKDLCQLSTAFEQRVIDATGMTLEEFVKKCGSTESINPILLESVQSEAKQIHESALKVEPKLTELLHILEGNGARLVGLEHKFKTVESIARKLTTTGVINDSLRYTMILNGDTYSADIMYMLEVLSNTGYKIDYVNNSWGKSTYQGLNVGLISPEGVALEVQFHTESSFAVKETMNHMFYEVARSKIAPIELVDYATEIMKRTQQTFNGNVPADAQMLTDSFVKGTVGSYVKYDNYFDFQNEYMAQSQKWYMQLPQEVKTFFDSYVGESSEKVGCYSTINGILRNIAISPKGEIIVRSTFGGAYSYTDSEWHDRTGMTIEEFRVRSIEAARLMSSAMEGSVLNKNTMIFRGMNIDALRSYGITGTESATEIYQKLTAQGDYYVDYGFMSSSPTPGVISEKDVKLVMSCPKGTAVLDLSAINSGEREVLLPAGSKFHIDGVTKTADGKIEIHMTALTRGVDTVTATETSKASVPEYNPTFTGNTTGVVAVTPEGVEVTADNVHTVSDAFATSTVGEMAKLFADEIIVDGNNYNVFKTISQLLVEEKSPTSTDMFSAMLPTLSAKGDVQFIADMKAKMSVEEQIKVIDTVKTFDVKAAITFENASSMPVSDGSVVHSPTGKTFTEQEINDALETLKTDGVSSVSSQIDEDYLNNSDYTAITDYKAVASYLVEQGSDGAVDFLSALTPTLVKSGEINFISEMKGQLTVAQQTEVHDILATFDTDAALEFEKAPGIAIDSIVVQSKNGTTYTKADLKASLETLSKEGVEVIAEQVLTEYDSGDSYTALEDFKAASSYLIEQHEEGAVDFLTAITPALIKSGDTKFISEMKEKLTTAQQTQVYATLATFDMDSAFEFETAPGEPTDAILVQSPTGQNFTKLDIKDVLEVIKTVGVSQISDQIFEQHSNSGDYTTITNYKAIASYLVEHGSDGAADFISALTPTLVKVGETNFISEIKEKLTVAQQTQIQETLATFDKDAALVFEKTQGIATNAPVAQSSTGLVITESDVKDAIETLQQEGVAKIAQEIMESFEASESSGNIEDYKALSSYLIEQQDSSAVDFLTSITPSLVKYGDTQFISEIKGKLTTAQQTQVYDALMTFDTKSAEAFNNISAIATDEVVVTSSLGTEITKADINDILKKIQKEGIESASMGIEMDSLFGDVEVEDCKSMISYLIEQQDSKVVDFVATMTPLLVNNGETQFISEIKGNLTVEQQSQVRDALNKFDTKSAEVFEQINASAKEATILQSDIVEQSSVDSKQNAESQTEKTNVSDDINQQSIQKDSPVKKVEQAKPIEENVLSTEFSEDKVITSATEQETKTKVDSDELFVEKVYTAEQVQATLADTTLKSNIIDTLKSSNVVVTQEVMTSLEALSDFGVKVEQKVNELTGMTIEEYAKQCGVIPVDPEVRKTLLNTAEEILNKAKQIEPRITGILHSLEGDGARLVGLNNKFKSTDGIIRKLRFQNNGSTSNMAVNINDSLRYTMVLSNETYSGDVMSKLQILSNAGYEVVNVNNSWGKSTYQGLNISLKSPEGVMIELQFHTESSYAVKEIINHTFYEIARSASVPYELVDLSTTLMAQTQQIFNGRVPINAEMLDKSFINSHLEKYKLYGDYEVFKAEYSKQSKKWYSQLPQEIKSYFTAYISDNELAVGNYQPVNGFLRQIAISPDGNSIYIVSTYSNEGTWYTNKEWKQKTGMTIEEFKVKSIEAAKQMSLAMDGSVLKENTMIYRGLNLNSLKSYGITGNESALEIYQKLTAQGDYYIDPGFMSSSPSPTAISDKAVVLDISCPKGTSIIDLSCINSSEHETLFPPSSKFHIDTVTIDEKGRIRIHLTALTMGTEVSPLNKAMVPAFTPTFTGNTTGVLAITTEGIEITSEQVNEVKNAFQSMSINDLSDTISDDIIGDFDKYNVFKTINMLLAKEDSPLASKMFTALAPTLTSMGDVTFMHDMKVMMSVDEQTKVLESLKTIDLDAANAFAAIDEKYDTVPILESNSGTGFTKAEIDSIAETIHKTSASDLAATIKDDIDAGLQTIEEHKSIISFMVENGYSEASDYLAALTPSLIEKGEIQFLSNMKEKLSIDEQIKVSEALKSFDVGSAVTFDGIKTQTEVAQTEVASSLEVPLKVDTTTDNFGEGLFDVDLSGLELVDVADLDQSIAVTPATETKLDFTGKGVEEIQEYIKQEIISNPQIHEKIEEYLQESSPDKVNVAYGVITSGVDVDINLTDCLSSSESIEILQRLERVDNGFESKSAKKFIADIQAKEGLFAEILDSDVPNAIIEKLVEGKMTVETTKGLFGNIETKIIFDIDGLKPQTMEKIGEIMSNLYPFSDYAFKTSTGLISDTDIYKMLPNPSDAASMSLEDYLGLYFPEEFGRQAESLIVSAAQYTEAPSFATIEEVIDYARTTIGLEDGINKVAAAFMKRINEVASTSEIGTSRYYEFLNLGDSGLDSSVHTKVMTKVINSSIELRKSISEAATFELTDVLSKRFGITDSTVIENMRDLLLGSEFIEKGIGEGSNWSKFVDLIRNPMAQAVQDGVDSGKEPVIWSGFDDKYHGIMDKKFTTISNTSIGDLYFIESVYSNWNMSSSTYKVEELWAQLSEVYAKACCSATNPYTGAKIDSIKFLYPMNLGIDECFGNLFKTSELPQIVSSGTIKTITMTRTNPETMEILDTVGIDITDLCEYFNTHSAGLGTHDLALNQRIFEMFLKKVKEAM